MFNTRLKTQDVQPSETEECSTQLKTTETETATKKTKKLASQNNC